MSTRPSNKSIANAKAAVRNEIIRMTNKIPQTFNEWLVQQSIEFKKVASQAARYAKRKTATLKKLTQLHAAIKQFH